MNGLVISYIDIEIKGELMRDVSKLVGKRIRALREGKGLSQEAESSGLHRSHVGQLERGETDVTLGTLIRVGTALGVPVSVLVAGIGEKPGAQAGR